MYLKNAFKKQIIIDIINSVTCIYIIFDLESFYIFNVTYKVHI